jgi:hypothetical protein
MKVVSQTIFNSAPVAEGQWVDCCTFRVPWSITVYGFASGDVVEIVTSNLPGTPNAQAPLPGDGQIVEGWPTISQDGRYPVTSTCHWVRVRKSAAGANPATTFAEICAISEVQGCS